MAVKYHGLSDYLKERYGGKVYKLSLSSGCTCPNRDGKISYGGCSFCSEGGSGDFASPFLPIDEQIELAKKKVEKKMPPTEKNEPETDGPDSSETKNIEKKSSKGKGYIAYFQSFTNTYGDTGRLYKMYKETIERDDIVILSVGTRPDCLQDDKLDMLEKLNRIKPVWVELGLQTIHEKIARNINRGYELSVFGSSYRKLKERGLTVIVHVILGLPGESEEDMLDTVRYLSKLNPVLDGIKLQLLHVLEGTAMAEEFRKKPFHILSLEEYSSLVIKCIGLLPEKTVVHRITGDGPKRLLIEPGWSGDKKRVLNELKRKIAEFESEA